ncbi:hypothetical protein [Escherichia coli]|nr:hypothetical protein [Salmonella enterica subsp. enterica serovar Enteritidis]
MAKKRKYKCKKCKHLEQKINHANQQEEILSTIAVLFALFMVFAIPVINSKFVNANNENSINLAKSKIIENEKKVMELLDMKIQVCKKEDELQPGIYSFHLDSDTSCDTYKREYRKLEEKYKA